MLCFCRRTELLSQTWVDGFKRDAEEEQAANGECGTHVVLSLNSLSVVCVSL